MGRLLFQLFLVFFGLVFMLGLVAALGIYIVWAMLRWLLTGHKPQVAVVWQQFSAMRKNFRQSEFRGPSKSGPQGAWTHRSTHSANEQVVDVEVREVVDGAPRLPPT
ncbi:hypothetical protein [Limnohabitans sp. DM1]|uniref:hypothetical protein n=1 Tax=Limnohabitans sp. DM1 TaxID=1597955 RepID=UPI000B7FA95E|nr:hypothetical protein [Limnohabitans sp. DM1]